jgi:hypothetical protein
MVVLLFVWLAGAVSGQAQPIRPAGERALRDYVILSPAEARGREAAVRVLAAPSATSERVSYRAFNGRTYTLNRYHGHFVDALLPDSWVQALSAQQIRGFIDRTDLIYQHLFELVGAEPAGEGPLPVAVLPDDVCGGALGCASLGQKGVEMLGDDFLNPLSWREITEDLPSGVLVHELTHNFDLFSGWIAYTPDSAHAWTDFLSFYYYGYTRDGGLDERPEEEMGYAVRLGAPFFRDPQADWKTCVVEGQCADRGIFPEPAWGGVALRLALLDGAQAVRDFTAFLRQYQETHQPPGQPEEKNDLYIEALAAGAHRNLSCVADAWHWPVSDALRDRMRQLYGTENPDCEDRDHDGFTPLSGDCNDHRAAVHPGAAEKLPHVDDDCDGRVDERIWQEPEGGFLAPVQISLPAEIAGKGDEIEVDDFIARMRSPQRVFIVACSVSIGAVRLANQAATRTEYLGMYGGGCYQGGYNLETGLWAFELGLAQGGADYTLEIQGTEPWPAPPWARTATPRPKAGRWLLTAATALPHLPVPPTEVRFWVSGYGIVGTVPYARAASFAWEPPPGVDPVAEGLAYRVEPLAHGVPAYGITGPRPFANP